MRRLLSSLALSALLGLASAPVSARVITDDDFCQYGLYAKENQPLGAGVVGRGGAHVYYDKEVCHLEGPRCQTARVPPGGHLLLGRHRDGLICVYFPNDRDTITGWVKANAVRDQPVDHHPPLRAWLGLWTEDGDPDGDPYIRFRLHKGVLMVKGESWTTGPEEHIGGLDGSVRRAGYRAYNAECNATFWLIGPFLVVTDDQYSCFAPGADFDGIYKLKHR
jgi:hypothetical protein